MDFFVALCLRNSKFLLLQGDRWISRSNGRLRDLRCACEITHEYGLETEAHYCSLLISLVFVAPLFGS